MDQENGIVGRDGELGLLDRAIDGLDGGPGRVLEVVGEPGIGKTRLTSELARRSEERGHLVLSGLAAEFERDLPFGLVIDALDDYLAAAQGREVERLGGEITGELATVFPSLHEYVEEDAPRLQDERFRAHRAIRGLLEGLAATRPMVLVLDDLHWADDASLEVVAALLRRPPAAPVLIALAFRTGQEPELIAATRRAAEQAGWLNRMELGPLEEQAAEELLSEDVDSALAADLLRESGGNPFYLTELARVAAKPRAGKAADPNAQSAPAAPGEVPAAVADALTDELRELDEEEATFLRAAAVAGEPFEPDLAARIAELTDERALEILDRLLELGVIRPTEVPRRFLFRHPLVRRAVYESAPPGWRLAAHGRAAEALGSVGASAVQRAHHVEYAAMPGDEEAIEVLSEAAAAASARAPASTVRWLEAALRLLPETGSLADRRLELLARLGSSQAARGQLVESITTISELLELLPEDTSPLRMQLIVACGTMKDLLGKHEEAREGLLQYRSMIDRGGPAAAALQVELASNALWTMGYDDALEWAEGAIAGAEDDVPLLFASHGALAWAQMLLARSEDGRATCDAGAAMIGEHADEVLAPRLDGFVNLAWANYMLGRFEQALATLERGTAIARSTGQGQFLAVLGQGRAVALATLGRLADAREQSLATVEAARLVRNPQALTYGLSASCWWSTLMGNLDDAERAASEALEQAERLDADTNTVRLVAAGALSEYHIQSGEPQRASELMISSCGDAELSLLAPGWRPMYFELLTRAELSAGRRDEAATAAERAEAAAKVLGLETGDGHAQRARGAVQLAAGEAEAAAQSALSAARSQDETGARIDAARSRLLAGRALAETGDREGAVRELATCERELAACGAGRMRDEAARELRKLGKRVRPARASAGEAGATGLAALSGREREVAELVTDRMTNREIAAHLVLSEKTIETHMRNLFAKLGVSSRVEVARTVEREREGGNTPAIP